MYEVISSSVYDKWFQRLSDSLTKKRIDARLSRIRLGNFGDHKSVGDGVCELRMDFGAGYRIYYAIRGNIVVLLLCGGDKSSQDSDIKLAKEIIKEA